VYVPTVGAEALSYFALVDTMFWPHANTMLEVSTQMNKVMFAGLHDCVTDRSVRG